MPNTVFQYYPMDCEPIEINFSNNDFDIAVEITNSCKNIDVDVGDTNCTIETDITDQNCDTELDVNVVEIPLSYDSFVAMQDEYFTDPKYEIIFDGGNITVDNADIMLPNPNAITKKYNGRFTPIGALEEDWAQIPDYVPADRELIIYKADKNHPARMKIGDGRTALSELSFTGDTAMEWQDLSQLLHMED